MIEPEIKKKIIDTIGRYEKKCDLLKDEIVGLKNALQQLTLLPMGIYVKLDDHINTLVSDLNSNAQADKIYSSVNVLIETLADWLTKESFQNFAIDVKINNNLNELLRNLSIPQELKDNGEDLKVVLEKPIYNESLSDIINDLTGIVIASVRLEQNRVKGFLQQLTDKLADFDSYFVKTSKNRNESSQDFQLLESGIEDNIQEMKVQMDSAQTLEVLSMKLYENLDLISGRIQEYKHNEIKRNKEHEEQIHILQNKLTQLETNSEEMKKKMSFQKLIINHDRLTGIGNRIAYDERIAEAFHRSKRSESVFSVAVADIDHFKEINDKFGHLAGDKVLKKIALIFKNSIRAVDFVARYGGEEFVFIFENTEKKEAFLVLEKLRMTINNSHFYYKNQKVNVTISFGLTDVEKTDTPNILFARADKSMYLAKSAGRNCTVMN